MKSKAPNTLILQENKYGYYRVRLVKVTTKPDCSYEDVGEIYSTRFDAEQFQNKLFIESETIRMQNKDWTF